MSILRKKTDLLQLNIFYTWKYSTYKIAITKTADKQTNSGEKPFTFFQAALFQWVNPKGVVMAVSGLTAFDIPHLQANLIYLLVGGPCVITWLFLGEALQNFLLKNANIIKKVILQT